MEESDVGILCYISSLPGFRGILKQRYSDFIVNEVDLQGNVAHLTSLDPPPLDAVEDGGGKEAEELSKDGDGPLICKSYASEIELLRSLAGDPDADNLEAFLGKVASGSEGQEDEVDPIILSPDSDKSHRTEMHRFFKEKFKFLVTDTVDGPDNSSKCIRVRLNSGGVNGSGRNSKKRKERGGGEPFDSRGSDSWPEHRGKFLRFHLYKENKDTQEALGVIGKMLGVQPRSFGFAGTKDKRAITTQRVTVFKKHASRLSSLNDRLIGIKVGDFCYVNEALVLGQLLGNRFTVTLRGVVADSEDTIRASAGSLGKNGFINYFGLQRFGSGSVPTHVIGATLFRGEWRSAVNIILDPRDGDILFNVHVSRESFRKAREYFKESGDIDGTLRQLPRQMVAERAILHCLKKHPGNFLQALKAIPRTLRMMYVHSYQSFLWNHAASMRVQKYGINQVVLGDLVYSKPDVSEDNVVESKLECEEDNSDVVYDDSHADEAPGTDILQMNNILAKVVTEEDLASGIYTIDDVILPMPGSRTTYPVNHIAEVYHDLAKKDGINLKESVHNVKEFSITSMTGSYRRVFQKPMDFQWELMSYSNADAPLAETDLDKLHSHKCMKTNREWERANGKDNRISSDPSYEKDSKPSDTTESSEGVGITPVECLQNSSSVEPQMALKLCFTLPSSSYATMAVRELLKESTSVAFQKTLNTSASSALQGLARSGIPIFLKSLFMKVKQGVRPHYV